MSVSQKTNHGIERILSGLNSVQAEAVRHTDGPLLILAGAGSGKTRVLVHRIAYLILEAGVPPWSILGITFTNKAATEMKARVEKLLPDESSAIWISTFHAACVRMLRRDIERIGFSRGFTIFDADDQLSLVKECLRDLNLSDKQYVPKAVLDQIGKAKDEMILPGDMFSPDRSRMPGGAFDGHVAEVYELYQKKLKKLNALDFDDIILMAIRLLRECGDIREYYQNRFKHVLVDEYQDTNSAQYTLISLLCGKWNNLCVVGDDDQSIYGWRGANIGNILGFENDYRGAKIIKLEQNYRSTKVILAAANSVILKNTHRKHKSLWTENGEGDAINCVKVENEYEEASYAAKVVKKLKSEQGISYNDCAILYRINAQSRAMENMLAREGVPYRIIGGFKFFDRKEIKDVIAYLRLLHNPSDDISFKRVINVPKRGVGAATVVKLEARAADMGVSIFEAATAAIANPRGFPELKSALGKLESFVALIRGMVEDARGLGTADILELVLQRSGIAKMYGDEQSEEARVRLENILEFKSEIIEFERNYVSDDIYYDEPQALAGDAEGDAEGAARLLEGAALSPESAALLPEGTAPSPEGAALMSEEADLSPEGASPSPEGALLLPEGASLSSEGASFRNGATLEEFLMHVSLISDIDSYDEDEEKVSLMTIHSAKGLEYDAVFIIGAEEGIFPGMRSMLNPSQLEEERRLCYVAITRAKKQLFITSAASRTLFGNTTYNRLSRFIADIPNSIISNKSAIEQKHPDVDNNGSRRPFLIAGGAGAGPGGKTGQNEFYNSNIRLFPGRQQWEAAKRGGTVVGPAGAAQNRFSDGRVPPGWLKGGRVPPNWLASPGAPNDDSAPPDAPDEYDNGRTYKVGDAVGHKKYGSGTVAKRVRDGSDFILEIEFENAGMRRFIESMVKLRIED